jgi:hypothetical protein
VKNNAGLQAGYAGIKARVTEDLPSAVVPRPHHVRAMQR